MSISVSVKENFQTRHKWIVLTEYYEISILIKDMEDFKTGVMVIIVNS